MTSPNYPPKTCILPGCDKNLVRRNESIAEWQRRKYCSLTCLGKSRTKPIKHGTPGGAMTHWRRKEEPCEPCRLAHNQYRQQLPPGSDISRKARARAMRRLAAMYPHEFEQLVARELRRDLASTIERHPAGKKLREAS